MEVLKIYTDGGCSGNQFDTNTGGWGSILVFGDNEKELYGGEKNTTNNRMELTALLMSFNALKRDNLSIEVYSDSSYLVNCFKEKWYENWQKNGWKNSTKKPVENKDLWENLIPFIEKNEISFFKIKGHVNLSSKVINSKELYRKFIEFNGNRFSYEEFEHIVNMNNRADSLAQKGIEEQISNE